MGKLLLEINLLPNNGTARNRAARINASFLGINYNELAINELIVYNNNSVLHIELPNKFMKVQL